MKWNENKVRYNTGTRDTVTIQTFSLMSVRLWLKPQAIDFLNSVGFKTRLDFKIVMTILM